MHVLHDIYDELTRHDFCDVHDVMVAYQAALEFREWRFKVRRGQ